jgi:Tfp pilus assembly protein PilF
MAKHSRAIAARPSRKKASPLKRRPAAKPVAAQPAVKKVAVPPAPAPVTRKPAYYEAIAVYESGVRALQRHDYTGAADHFRSVVQRFPDERELLERARLYLRVCERETANRPAGPRTPQELIYAATVSLNAGDAHGAIAHLRRALAEDPENDHGHYIMAVTLTDQGQHVEAVDFLRQAIELNPENRSLARQDPDLAVLRETDGCRELLDAPISSVRRRPRPRR